MNYKPLIKKKGMTLQSDDCEIDPNVLSFSEDDNYTEGSLPEAIKRYINKLNEPKLITLYPNGAPNYPAYLSINTRHVFDNPFGTAQIFCRVEVRFNGVWSEPSASGSSGAKAFQYGDSQIVLQVGNNGWISNSASLINPFGYTGLWTKDIQCIIKVFKLCDTPQAKVASRDFSTLPIRRILAYEGYSYQSINNSSKPAELEPFEVEGKEVKVVEMKEPRPTLDHIAAGNGEWVLK